MSGFPPTPDYQTPPPPTRRTLSTWLILLVVWSVGLIVWALYALAAVYLLWRIM